jgi:hypothetical protein
MPFDCARSCAILGFTAMRIVRLSGVGSREFTVVLPRIFDLALAEMSLLDIIA